MPDLKLNQIPDATLPLDGDEFLLVDQDGLSRKITVNDLPASGGNVISVNGQTGIVTLLAADVGAANTAQGDLADTAVQPGQLHPVATSGDYNDLGSLPDLRDFAFIDLSAEGGITLNPNRSGLADPDNPEFPFIHQFHTNVNPSEDMVNELTTLMSNRLQLNGDFQYGQASSGGLLLMDNRVVHEGTGELGRASILQNTVELNGAGSFTPSANVNDTSVIMRNGSTCSFVAPVTSNVTLEEECEAGFVCLYNGNLTVRDQASIDFCLLSQYNINVEDGGIINNLNGIRAHFTNYQGGKGTLTGGTEGIQLGVFGDLDVDFYTGTSVTYGAQGDTNSVVGFRFSMQNPGPIQQAAGIDINMGQYDTTQFRRAAANLSNGAVQQFYQVSTISNAFFDQANIYANGFHVTSGNPIEMTEMLLNNFAADLKFDDDFDVGPLGLGVATFASVGNIQIASGVEVQKAALFLAGMSVEENSDGGTIEEFASYKAMGLIDFGTGGTIVAEKTIAFLNDYLGPVTLGSERWGLCVRDPEAENFMSKSLVIGGSTEKVANDDIAFEVADKKALRLPVLTTLERDALVAEENMVLLHDDGVDVKLERYNGASWEQL